MTNKFKLGDLVAHKAFPSMPMVVMAIEGSLITCKWKEKGGYVEDNFIEEELEHFGLLIGGVRVE